MKKLLQKAVLASLIIALPLNAHPAAYFIIGAVSALIGVSQVLPDPSTQEDQSTFVPEVDYQDQKDPSAVIVSENIEEKNETAAPSANTEPAQNEVRADIEDFQPIVTESETTVAEPTFSPVLTAIVVMVALKIGIDFGIDLWNSYWTPQTSPSFDKTPKNPQVKKGDTHKATPSTILQRQQQKNLDQMDTSENEGAGSSDTNAESQATPQKQVTVRPTFFTSTRTSKQIGQWRIFYNKLNGNQRKNLNTALENLKILYIDISNGDNTLIVGFSDKEINTKGSLPLPQLLQFIQKLSSAESLTHKLSTIFNIFKNIKNFLEGIDERSDEQIIELIIKKAQDIRATEKAQDFGLPTAYKNFAFIVAKLMCNYRAERTKTIANKIVNNPIYKRYFAQSTQREKDSLVYVVGKVTKALEAYRS